MKVHRASVTNYINKERYRYLVSFVRLKLHFRNGYTKKYDLKYIAGILGCGTTKASRTLNFLKKHRFITFDEGKVMRFTNLYSNEKNEKQSVFNRIAFTPSMTDDEIHGELCLLNLENLFIQQKYISSLKRDQNQAITSSQGKSQMFHSIAAMQSKFRKYANKEGFRAETVDEFRLSDTKAAEHFGVPVSYYRRNIVPRMKQTEKLNTNTIMRLVKDSERGTNKITPESCFVCNYKMLTCYREYHFRPELLEKVENLEQARFKKSQSSTAPLSKADIGMCTLNDLAKYFRNNSLRSTSISIPKKDSYRDSNNELLVVVADLGKGKILDFQTDL